MTTRALSKRLVGAVIALSLVALGPALSACGRDLPATLQVGTISISPSDREPLPAIGGPTLTGSSLDVASLKGKVVVLNSWASWCEPCKKEVPDLVTMAKAADPAKVAFVGLNVSDDGAAAASFAKEYGIAYPSIVDSTGAQLATIPGVPPKALPSTVVIDRDGRIAARVIGAVDPPELERIVDSVSAETPGS